MGAHNGSKSEGPTPEPLLAPDPQELYRIRRGLGLVLIMAGGMHWGLMVFASLYSLGRIRLLIPARLWSEMYYAHFLFLVMAGALYLFLNFRNTRVFHFEALSDYLVAVGIFIILMSVTGLVLVKGLITPWFSLTPGAFLNAYGFGLWLGRPFGFLPKNWRPPQGLRRR